MPRCGFCNVQYDLKPGKAPGGKVNKNEKKREHCAPKCRGYANQLRWLLGLKKKFLEKNR